MDVAAYDQMELLAARPEALSDSVEYVAQRLCQFLKKNESVLICFQKQEFPMLNYIFEQAVLQAGGIPVAWGPDYRWKSLLRLAFNSRATVIIGPPLVILGLGKLVKATGTPLNIRNVVTSGYPCLDWMIDGITRSLDCGIWDCYVPGSGAVVAGFSCSCSRGIHIRPDVYEIQVTGEDGSELPEGMLGMVTIVPVAAPELRSAALDHARMVSGPCRCGLNTPRLLDIGSGSRCSTDIEVLGQELQSWSSILDCRVVRGPYGLEIELVVFPGEKLPNLPTCAKRIIRSWNPEQDEPFAVHSGWKISAELGESH